MDFKNNLLNIIEVRIILLLYWCYMVGYIWMYIYKRIFRVIYVY